MKFNKIFRLAIDFLVKLLISLFITIASIYMIWVLFCNIYLEATTLAISSTSPDRTIKVEFSRRSRISKTSVDLITPDGFWGKKTNIYSTQNSDVRIPEGLQIYWSENSTTLLAVSKDDNIIFRNERQNTKLNSGDNLLLMYNISNRKLSHNLPRPKTDNRLSKDDIKQVKWHNCHICK
jgi:hypothetical protein